MSHHVNEMILENHFEDAIGLTRLELIAELGMVIYESSFISFYDLAEMVANKRANEGPDGPQ